jgi:Holliday junction resolvasome RuvABC endonuclease subunit
MSPKQSKKWRYLLAVDPSLTCSGWALFQIGTEQLCGIGKIKSLKTEFSLPTRYKDLQKQIAGLYAQIGFGPEDVLVCEAPTTMRDPKAAIKVEQVRGIFETLARTKGVLVPGRLNPRTVHHEVLGLKGKQAPRKEVKSGACSIARSLFENELIRLGFNSIDNLSRHQDIVDALLIGTVVMSRLKRMQSSNQEFSLLSLENW